MAKKVYIQPGVWIVLIVLGIVGAFFGIKALQKSGKWGKMTEAVAPSGSSKVKKVGGKTPIIVALNTWVGFAPGVYYNEGLLPTEKSRFEYPVQFIIMDNFDDSRTAWKDNRVNVICNTADVLPTEIPSMMDFEPKVFMQIDWSRGGDKIIVRPGINSISDLRGKTVAVALNSPSQTLIIRALESGGILYDDLKIKSMATALDAAAAFKSGQVDVAIVWSPDDEDCLASVPNSKVLISTKEAAYCIADIFYAKAEFIRTHQNELNRFVAGWLEAASELNTDVSARTKAQKLMATYFNVPEAVMNLDNARFCTYGDNENFFNLLPTQCDCVKGEDLYTKMAQAFNRIGLAPDNVPSWRSITDISILTSLKSNFSGAMHESEQGIKFSAPVDKMKTVPAIATKRITINFATGLYVLTDEAKYIIDKEFGPIARSFAGYRVRIEGNTDNVGSISSNKTLSLTKLPRPCGFKVS